MQDFYILQRTESPLDGNIVKLWYYTVELLAPEGVIAGDDDTNSLMLGLQNDYYVYIIPLKRHLTILESEKIVEGYSRITNHDFEIEISNVYQDSVDFGHPFEYDLSIDEEAKTILHEAIARHAHNQWIQSKMQSGWRFGLNLSISEKTHPAMRPWDDLPESYRRLPNVSDKELIDFYSRNSDKFY